MTFETHSLHTTGQGAYSPTWSTRNWHYSVMDTDTAGARHSHDVSDADVLMAVAGGDAEALAVLWQRHATVVIGFCIRRCATADDVADAVAETFMAAWRAAGRYRPETPTAVPWLLGIARRVVGRQHRATARSLRLVGRLAARAGGSPRFVDEEYEAVDAAIDAAQQAPAVEEALRALPTRERDVLELVAYDQLEPGEAAKALGVSPNAARLRLARARRRLRERLPELGADHVNRGRLDDIPATATPDIPRADDRPGDNSREP